MEAVEVATGTRDERVPEFLLVFCVSTHVESFPLLSCPALSVRVRLGHISTPEYPTDRRLLFFADNGINTALAHVKAPLLIEVTTASCIEVHKNKLYIKLSNITLSGTQNTVENRFKECSLSPVKSRESRKSYDELCPCG